MREVEWINDYETVVSRSPSDEPIGQRIINHLICFHNERCDHVVVVVVVVGVVTIVVLHLSLSFLLRFILLVKKLRRRLVGLYKQNKIGKYNVKIVS